MARTQFSSGPASPPADVRLEGVKGDLKITLTGTTDSITIQSGLATAQVERLVFADGAVWNLVNRTDIVNTTTGAGGNDMLYGYAGPDLLQGLDGNDNLSGNIGNDVLEGGTGNDTLEGWFGDDVLDGGDGNDILTDTTYQGGGGQDVLRGGRGDDTLNGGDGNDTYIFNSGDGQDAITESIGGVDRIQLGSGILTDAVRLEGLNGNLRISFAGITDSLTIKNWFAGNNNKIEQVQFADGTTWNIGNQTDFIHTLTGTTGNDSLSGGIEANVMQGLGGDDYLWDGGGSDTLDGGAGNDRLYAGDGDDILQGGAGNDTLDGGYGADTYVFNLGDGQDTITNYDFGTGDALRFGPGVLASAVRQNTVGSDMVFTITGTTDSVTVKNWSANADYRLDQLLFADGTEWALGSGAAITIMGTGGNDVLYGGAEPNILQGLAGNDNLSAQSGDDTLVGGLGNDILDGGFGNDSYQFNRGDGQDIINNYDPYDNGDAIRLGVGISSGDVRLEGINNDLRISFLGLTDSVMVKNWFYTNDYKVERLQFADGTAWDLGSRTDLINTVTGTTGNDSLSSYGAADIIRSLDGNDILSSGAGDDLLDGGSGNDMLRAEAGNDILQGGLGADSLHGGTGNDTYLFSRGDGQDSITDYDTTAGNSDVIQLAAGIGAASVLIQGVNGDLILGIAGTTDSMTVKNWFGGDNNHNKIEIVRFADGIVWDLANRTDIVNTITGTLSDNSLVGWSEPNIIRGLDGNDTLQSQGGDDVLDGGSGNDLLYGGLGNDVVEGGDGTDTLNGDAGDDVLRGGGGQDVLNGGDGDDSLGGGFGNDALNGGSGNDTYIFGVGDGQDTITDFDSLGISRDTILLGAGFDSQATELQGVNNDLVIRFTGVMDTVTVKNWFYADMNYNKIETLQFADGTVWDLSHRTNIVNSVTGTIANDYLNGSSEPNVIHGLDGNDSMSSGAGDDVLIGGAGDDQLYAGAGHDVLEGKDGVDTLVGDAGDDVLDGGTGNDSLNGGEGSDIFVGGLGNDILTGGFGNEKYVFALGDGQDTIINAGGVGDVIELGPGLVPANVSLNGVNNNLVISITGATDTITVKNWFVGEAGDNRVESLQFGDGMVWNIGTRTDIVNTLTGTSGNDTPTGGSEPNIIHGLQGNDYLNGRGAMMCCTAARVTISSMRGLEMTFLMAEAAMISWRAGAGMMCWRVAMAMIPCMPTKPAMGSAMMCCTAAPASTR